MRALTCKCCGATGVSISNGFVTCEYCDAKYLLTAEDYGFSDAVPKGIRRNALQELKEAAYSLGCNAVIGVDFDYITLDPETANISGGTTYQPYVFCVTANGNAVVIEKIEE